MRDFRKFCRPKATKHPKIGDPIILLNCGEKISVDLKEFEKILKFFKVNSFNGETTQTPGTVLVNKFGKEAVFSPENYNSVKNEFEFISITGNKLNSSLIGDIICHNSLLNRDATFTFLDWLNVDDSWEIIGLYEIETFEEEDTIGGEYVILANGHTLIIKAEDYSKVSSNWEKVDEIHAYVEIGGIKWATMNIGANSITDTGLYFQWGDTQGYTAAQVGSSEGKKEFSNEFYDYKFSDGEGVSLYELVDELGYHVETDYGLSKYTHADEKTVLESSDDAVTVALEGNWRIPTSTEFETLLSATTYSWTNDYENSGVAGVILTSTTDSSKKLFFPAAGECGDSQILLSGESGAYWSSSRYVNDVKYAYYLRLNNSGGSVNDSGCRSAGLLIRGILDE